MKKIQYLLFTGSFLFLASLAQAKDDAHSSASPASNAAPSKPLFTGKVLEATNAGPYTYVQIDTGKEKVWAAAPQFNVKPGDSVTIADGMEMPKYHSKTLNRDFKSVYFTGNISVNGDSPAAAAPSVKSGQLPKGHPPITGSEAPSKMDFSGIKKAKGGKTIEEIYSGKSNLSGKEVSVRGKVVKYNDNILGKNWLHLRDGTGAPGSNDLLVTTSTPAKVGDTVLATGVIVLNKDFGSNYKYDVMIDNAKVTVE